MDGWGYFVSTFLGYFFFVFFFQVRSVFDLEGFDFPTECRVMEKSLMHYMNNIHGITWELVLLRRPCKVCSLSFRKQGSEASKLTHMILGVLMISMCLIDLAWFKAGEIFRGVLLRPSCRLQNDMIIYSTGIRLASVAKVIGQLSKWGKSNQASDCDGKSFWKQKISSVQTDLVTSKDFQARKTYAIRLTWVFCKRARGWSPDLQQDGHKAMMQIGILKPAADVYVKTYTYVNVNIYIYVYIHI